MICKNTVFYYAQYQGRTVEISANCGDIDNYTNVILCDNCCKNKHRIEEKKLLREEYLNGL